MNLLAILQLINAAAPGVITLVQMIRHKDGSTTVIQYLDEADAATTENQKLLAEFFASKGKTPPAQG